MHHDDPFPILTGVYETLSAGCSAGPAQVLGGLVGYITYETVSFFEKDSPINCRMTGRWPILSYRMKC